MTESSLNGACVSNYLNCYRNVTIDVNCYSKLDGSGHGPAEPSRPGLLSANHTETSLKLPHVRNATSVP